MNKNDIIIEYGTDFIAMSRNVCEQAELARLIGNKKSRIGIKPNLVNTSTADQGATTHPEIIEGVIIYLQENGFFNIAVIEGSWVGDRTAAAFRVCGYTALRDQYQIELIDTQLDSYREYDCSGMKLNICDSAQAVDFMINVPVMKGHCQTTITCALKNNKGVIPDREKRRFHTMGLHKPIAHLNTKAKNDFILVDGICGDLDFEEGGNPVPMNRLMGFMDPVLCDAYVCSLLGYSVDEVPYLRLAADLGVGSLDISNAKVIELHTGKDTRTELKFTRRIKGLAELVEAKDACSACYGSLIHALDRMGGAGWHSLGKERICIGQGFKEKAGRLGVGSCTSRMDHSLTGCPPKAIDIVAFLKDALKH